VGEMLDPLYGGPVVWQGRVHLLFVLQRSGACPHERCDVSLR